MPKREMSGWLILAGSLLGLFFFSAKLLGLEDEIRAPWLWIGGSIVFLVTLFWILLRIEPADERDRLIGYRSLTLAAQVFIFGLMVVMLFSGGGSEGTVSKTVLNCLMAVAAAAAASRMLYLSRRAV